MMSSVLGVAGLMTLLPLASTVASPSAIIEALADHQNSVVEAGCERPTYRALTGQEIRSAVVGSAIIYDWHGAIYRGAIEERFSARTSRFEIQYDLGAGLGTYEVREGRLCTHEFGSEPESCRLLFVSDRCGFALSAPDNDQPLYRVRIVHSRDP